MRTLFSLLLCIVSAGLPTAHAAGKPLELNYSIFFPATHGHTLLATEWAREVEKRTDGAVKINIFAGATLTPADPPNAERLPDGAAHGAAQRGAQYRAGDLKKKRRHQSVTPGKEKAWLRWRRHQGVNATSATAAPSGTSSACTP